MNARDELFELLDHVAFPETPEERDAAWSAIEAMLQPRTITTIEELTLLEPGTVIQGPVWHEETYKCTGPATFHTIAQPVEYWPSEIAPRGPFTILHEPEATK